MAFIVSDEASLRDEDGSTKSLEQQGKAELLDAARELFTDVRQYHAKIIRLEAKSAQDDKKLAELTRAANVGADWAKDFTSSMYWCGTTFAVLSALKVGQMVFLTRKLRQARYSAKTWERVALMCIGKPTTPQPSHLSKILHGARGKYWVEDYGSPWKELMHDTVAKSSVKGGASEAGPSTTSSWHTLSQKRSMSTHAVKRPGCFHLTKYRPVP